jgi:hypothetical protein
MYDEELIDFEDLAQTKEYQWLRYFVCELQRVDLAHMDENGPVRLWYPRVCNSMLRFSYTHVVAFQTRMRVVWSTWRLSSSMWVSMSTVWQSGGMVLL